MWPLAHPDITVFNLDELANVTMPPTSQGAFKGSEDIARLIRENWR